MPFNIIEKQRTETQLRAAEKPTVIKWKGVDMVRNHSVMVCVHEIVNAIKEQDLISINIIGKQSTGKTTLAEVLAHGAHKISEFPFKINFFGKTELINLEETVKNLTPTNQIIVFEDMSFLGANATSKQVKIIESVLSTIRHLPGGKDVRIILIKNFHYTKAVPPFLRQNDFTFVSSVDPNEIKNLNDLFGAGNNTIVELLLNYRAEILLRGTFTIKLGNKGKLTYFAKKPFLPYIYANANSVRIIVSPKREWIDPICSICSTAVDADSIVDVKRFAEEFTKAYDKTAHYAVKQMLKEQGINSYGPNYQQARKYLDRGLEMKQFNLEDLAVAFGIKTKRTRLDKKPDGVLLDTA